MLKLPAFGTVLFISVHQIILWQAEGKESRAELHSAVNKPASVRRTWQGLKKRIRNNEK